MSWSLVHRNNLGACQKYIFLGLIPEILIQECWICICCKFFSWFWSKQSGEPHLAKPCLWEHHWENDNSLNNHVSHCLYILPWIIQLSGQPHGTGTVFIPIFLLWNWARWFKCLPRSPSHQVVKLGFETRLADSRAGPPCYGSNLDTQR